MFPQLIKIKQNFSSRKIPDLTGEVENTLSSLNLRLNKGARIAVAVGSRGISNNIIIIKTLIDYLKKLGARPFIVPAMGSHGGATAEGQKEVLEGLGISESAMSVPVESSMEVIELPAKGLSHKLFMDKNAYEADGIVIVNRIKPHTSFHGTYESGLIKMMVLGLGKQKQAEIMHQLGVEGLRDSLAPAAEQVIAGGKILLGLGIVEDAFKNTMMVKAVPADHILEKEPELLKLAKSNMPRLPVDDIDILIIDIMGKNLSGTGIDPNITGRIGIRGYPDPGNPAVKTIIVNGLSDESRGNALGVGLADIITKKLFAKIDFNATYANVITTTFLSKGFTPLVAEDQVHALEIALSVNKSTPTGDLRIVHIKDTLHLEEVRVSSSIYEQIKSQVTPLSDFEGIYPGQSH